MKKKVIAMALTFSCLTASAFAEQPETAKYRDILQSGKFYVEYELNYAKKILAVQDNKRMDYTIYKSKGNPYAGAGLALINPFLALGSMFIKNESKVPTAYYEAGKFYQFDNKKKAHMAIWNQLNDPNLNPMEGWNAVKQKLALPEELAIFAPNDMFAENYAGADVPKFIESGNASINGKDFVYDKYSTSVLSHSGNVLFGNNYYFYYGGGELKHINTFTYSDNSGEVLLRSIEIKKITQELPENILKIPEGCKVYAAGIGDMNDLIEKPVLAEEY